MHDSRSPGVRQELRAIPQQAPRRQLEPHPHHAHPRVLHVQQGRAARAQLLHHHAEVALWAIDHQLLVGLELLSVRPFARDDARPADLKLISLAPHRLHQHAEVQLAASRHGERLGVVRLLHPEGHVPLELPEQPLPQLPTGDELPFAPRERRVVDLAVHRDRGLLHCDPREALEVVGRRDRLPDLHAGEPRQRHDLACGGLLQLHPL